MGSFQNRDAVQLGCRKVVLVFLSFCYVLSTTAQVPTVLAKARPTNEEVVEMNLQSGDKAVVPSDSLDRAELRARIDRLGAENDRPNASETKKAQLSQLYIQSGLEPRISLDSATAWVLRKHPLAFAAEAVELRGPTILMGARGGYDPNIVGSYDHKDYTGSDYFEYSDVGVKWQSPYALKVEAGHMFSDGLFINPEKFISSVDVGQAYISLKLPVLQGLMTDKYRVGVKQGEVAIERNRAAAEMIRNELRYDLAVAYTNWAYAITVLNIYEETEDLIALRLANTIGLYQQGDKPAVDTLEARVALFNQELTTQQARVEAEVAEQELRAIFWDLPVGALPTEDALLAPIPEVLGPVSDNPELAEIRASFADLQLERTLKKEYLKPELNVGYTFIGAGFDFTASDEPNSDITNVFTDAYKIGATFRYPIRNRAARAGVELADIKLAETGAKLEAKRQSLVTKAEAYSNAAFSFDAQLTDVASLAAQAAQLLQFERELFDLGESTQFLLNSREQGLQKVLLTGAKLEAMRAKAIWSWRKAVGDWEP